MVDPILLDRLTFEFLEKIVPVTPVMFFLAPSILHLGFVEITHPNNSWYKKRYQAGFPVSKTAAINGTVYSIADYHFQWHVHSC